MREQLRHGQRGVALLHRTPDGLPCQHIVPGSWWPHVGHQQGRILPHGFSEGGHVAPVEQAGNAPWHHDQGVVTALAADEPERRRLLRPPCLDREIRAGGKEPRVPAAAREGERGDVQLETPVFVAAQELPHQGSTIRPGGRSARLELVEQAVPMGIIHRAAVVRIDQTQVPELRPLIGIGHARGGDLQEGLGKGVEQAAVADALLQDPEVVQEALVGLRIKDPRT